MVHVNADLFGETGKFPLDGQITFPGGRLEPLADDAHLAKAVHDVFVQDRVAPKTAVDYPDLGGCS